MKTFSILRHHTYSRENPNFRDYEFPLGEKGKSQAANLGRFIRSQHWEPDIILSSSAQRALDSAQGLKDAGKLEAKFISRDDLYQTSPAHILSIIKQLPSSVEHVLIVNHNPTIEELVSELTGSFRGVPTGTYIRLEYAIDNWNDIHPKGALQSTTLLTPEDYSDV